MSGHCDPPAACATERTASQAPRYLVLATGHVRSVKLAAESIYDHIVVPTRPAVVDVVLHVWHDEGYRCEAAALDVARRRNFTVLYDPRECDHFHAPGFHNQQNQWRTVHRALGATLSALPGAPCGVLDVQGGMPCAETLAWAEARYALVLKTRTDISFKEDVDLEAVRAAKAALPEVRRANGHFAQIFPCVPALDAMLLATPALLAQHFTVFRKNYHHMKTGFLEVRLEHHGVAPASFDATKTDKPFCLGAFNVAVWYERLYNASRGAPRCAPLFAETLGGAYVIRDNPCSPLASRDRSMGATGDGYCHANFGEATTTAAAQTVPSEAAFTCPAAMPHCIGHVHNERWGTCQRSARRRLLASFAPEMEFQQRRPLKWNRETPEPVKDEAWTARCRAALSSPPRVFAPA